MSWASSRPVGPGAEYQRAGPGRTWRRLEAVHGAGGGFGEHRGVGGQPVDGEHQAVATATYSAKKPGKLLPSALQVRAQDQPAGQAVVAVPAVDVRVDGDLLADR